MGQFLWIGKRWMGQRIAKEAANYRQGYFIDDSQYSCNLCVKFRPRSGTCTSVEGEIDRNAVCDYFDTKKLGFNAPINYPKFGVV